MNISIPSTYLDPSQVCTSNEYSNTDRLCGGCNFDGSDTQYNAWVTGNCPSYFAEQFYGPQGQYNFNASQQARLLANSLLTNYEKFNHISPPDSPNFNQFQDVLHRFCGSYGISPGVCQNYLTNVLCTQPIDSTSGANYISWCGCAAQRGSECSAGCNTSDTIKRVDVSDGNVELCTKNICVINGVSVTVANSNTQGVTINQICPGCVANCVCIIEDVEVVGTNLNINQQCGPERICYSQSSDGTITQVQCPRSGGLLSSTFVVFVVFIVILVVVAIIIAILISNNKEE